MDYSLNIYSGYMRETTFTSTITYYGVKLSKLETLETRRARTNEIIYFLILILNVHSKNLWY